MSVEDKTDQDVHFTQKADSISYVMKICKKRRRTAVGIPRVNAFNVGRRQQYVHVR
jgi:hypothetical protein